MNVYDLNNKEICDIVIKVASKYKFLIRSIGVAKVMSCFIIVLADTDDTENFGNYLIDLNDVFLGVVDCNGNILDTEANILATGYEGAIILGSTSVEEFNRYMLVAAHAGSKLVYKNGVLCG